MSYHTPQSTSSSEQSALPQVGAGRVGSQTTTTTTSASTPAQSSR